MTKQPSASTGNRRRVVRRLTIALILLMLYVFSIGPMFWYWYEARYLDGPVWVALLYEPLRLATRLKFFEDFINEYINWWIL